LDLDPDNLGRCPGGNDEQKEDPGRDWAESQACLHGELTCFFMSQCRAPVGMTRNHGFPADDRQPYYMSIRLMGQGISGDGPGRPRGLVWWVRGDFADIALLRPGVVLLAKKVAIARRIRPSAA
jgi:hypothetical protein